MRTLSEIIDTISCNGQREMTEERILQAFKEYDDEHWISVLERLPEIDPDEADEVIANYAYNGLDENGSICAAFYMGKFYVLAEWLQKGIKADQIVATHWRALPIKTK